MSKITYLRLSDINLDSLRLVTFGSTGEAVAWVMSGLAATEAVGSRFGIGAKMTAASARSVRQAICRVGGEKQVVSHEKGETITLTKGDRAGSRVTLETARYKPFSAEQYSTACKNLADKYPGFRFEQDDTTTVGTGADRITEYAITRDAA